MISKDMLEGIRARLAEIKGWRSCFSDHWPVPADDAGAIELGVHVVGSIDDSGEKYPLITIDTAQYDEEEGAGKIAALLVATNPNVVAMLLDHIEHLERELQSAQNLQNLHDLRGLAAKNVTSGGCQ